MQICIPRPFLRQAILVSVAYFSILACSAEETWPSHDVSDEQRAFAAEAALSPGTSARIDFPVSPYRPDDPYLYFSERQYTESDRVKLDDEGVPMVRYGESFEYNPVTVSQFILTAHAHNSNEAFSKIVAGTERLLKMQANSGAFPYEFSYRYYSNEEVLAPGWISGMAQGQALSALARAFLVTGDVRYEQAGDLALSFLQVPFSEGGPRADMSHLDPSLSGYIFFLEYPVDPFPYTLNGYMFTLLGLYDWWRVFESQEAGQLFREGVKSLRKVLPYYDFGALSSYDLTYLTHNRELPHFVARYHSVHVLLLLALGSVTDSSVLETYANRWYGAASASRAYFALKELRAEEHADGGWFSWLRR